MSVFVSVVAVARAWAHAQLLWIETVRLGANERVYLVHRRQRITHQALEDHQVDALLDGCRQILHGLDRVQRTADYAFLGKQGIGATVAILAGGVVDEIDQNRALVLCLDRAVGLAEFAHADEQARIRASLRMLKGMAVGNAATPPCRRMIPTISANRQGCP